MRIEHIGDATHSDLCLLTAHHFLKAPGGAKLALYEYQGFATSEFPDVFLVGLGWTKLYEIKVSRSDFLADQKKKCREKHCAPRFWGYNTKMPLPPEKWLIQYPHLGIHRYYVCESGLILPEELPEGWGLYWVNGKKFFQKQESGKWRPDVHAERDIITHAFRRFASGDTTGILVNNYAEPQAGVVPHDLPL